jgi:amino acid adenylation domain-containing protein
VLVDEAIVSPSECAVESRTVPSRQCGPTNLAYVMYTSGSTGTPKGILIEHRSIIRLVKGNSYARFGADRVFLQLAPVAFDASTFEIWGALLHGARLVLAPEGPIDLEVIEALVHRHRVTTLWLTASLFNLIVETRPTILSEVEEVVTGGEPLSVPHIRMAFERLRPFTRLINGYGPTECTTFACCHLIPRDEFAPSGSIPIGYPIANTTAYVLDDRARLVPIGVAGELYLGGEGLARGYLNRPALTADRFIPDSWGTEPGARLYRTGDLVRRRSDGSLEFLGRRDRQLKIHGFRIEPGEVESVLGSHPQVLQSAVLGRDDGGGAALVAFIVPKHEGSLAPGDLRAYLGELLPAYMIPATFKFLAELPLNTNGKLDRRALRELPLSPPPIAEYVAPRNPTEATLSDLWSELLGVKHVGIHDDFFELGGHSLLVLRLWSRLRESFGKNCSVNFFFHHRTIERIALALEPRVEAGTNQAGQGPRDQAESEPFVFCLDYAAPLARHMPDVPIFPLEQFMDTILNYDSVEEIARIYNERVCEQQPRGPYRICGSCGLALVAFEMARQLNERGAETGLLALLEPRAADQSVRARRVSIRRYLRVRLAHHLRVIGELPLAARPRYVFTRIGSMARGIAIRLRIVPSPVEKSDWWQARPKLLRALMSYRARPYPGTVDLFLASDRVALHGDDDFGWGAMAQGGATTYVIPGAHEDIMSEPGISRLAAVFRQCYLRSLGGPHQTLTDAPAHPSVGAGAPRP